MDGFTENKAHLLQKISFIDINVVKTARHNKAPRSIVIQCPRNSPEQTMLTLQKQDPNLAKERWEGKKREGKGKEKKEGRENGGGRCWSGIEKM